MKTFTLKIDSEWVLKHRNDDVLPIEKLSLFLANEYKNLILSDEKFDSLTCSSAGNISDS